MNKVPFFERKVVFQIKTWKLYAIAALLCLCAYIAWEYYWYLKNDFTFIKWHTHLFSTLVQSLFIFLTPYLLLAKLFSKNYSKKALTLIGAIVFSLVFVEFLLIVTGYTKNYIEARAGYYQSPYAQNMGNLYNIRPSNSLYKLKSQEYEFERESNSLGYPDKEWQIEKDSSLRRIVTIGDSFTEGDGAAFDSTYPSLLERIIDGRGFNVEVLNAGVSGSDPFFGFKNFKDRIVQYHPDIVLQSISSDDLLFDTMLRGGLERFKGDKLELRKGPWWEWLTATSYFYRKLFEIFGYNINKPGANNKEKLQSELNSLIHDLMIKYNGVASEYGVNVYFFIQPLKHEMKDGEYMFDYKNVKKYGESLDFVEVIDLMPCFKSYTEEAEKNAISFYWEIDGHHNASGYKMMASCLYEEIEQNLMINR